MDKHLLSRRQFNARCAAVGLSLPAAGAVIEVLSGASVPAADAPPRTVKLPNGKIVPAVGQGSWHLGQGRHPAALEEEALRTAISLGMTLIDTSGNYGNGHAEELISHVIADQRERVLALGASAAGPVISSPHVADLHQPRLRRAALQPDKSGLCHATIHANFLFLPGPHLY